MELSGLYKIIKDKHNIKGIYIWKVRITGKLIVLLAQEVYEEEAPCTFRTRSKHASIIGLNTSVL